MRAHGIGGMTPVQANAAALLEVVHKYGTPAYAYDLDRVRVQVAGLRAALPADIDLLYSLKANPLPDLCRLLAGCGFGAEVASPGELRAALAAGIHPARVLVNGPYKHPDVLATAAASPETTLSVDSISELTQLAEAGPAWRIVLRLRPDFDPAGELPFGPACRFGIPFDELAEVPALLGQSALRMAGFHIYAGTQVTRPEDIVANLRDTYDLASRAAEVTGCTPEVIGLGGGFGIPYGPEQPHDLDLRPVGTELRRLRGLAGTTRLMLELGRYLVAPAGWYLTKVVGEQHCRDRPAVVVDGGIHHRPDLCGLDLPRKSFAPLVFPAGRQPEGQAVVDIVGCLCLPWDVLASEVKLPPLRPGDILAFPNSGAYGLTAAPTSFISHPPPAEAVFDRAGGVRAAGCDLEGGNS